jgi:hypothetical protein
MVWLHRGHYKIVMVILETGEMSAEFLGVYRWYNTYSIG